MKLDTPQVKKVARLAGLDIDEKDTKLFSRQLSKVLDYVEQLEQVDTSKTSPTYNVNPNINIARKDKMGTCLTQKEALQNGSVQNKYFRTKGVFGND